MEQHLFSKLDGAHASPAACLAYLRETSGLEPSWNSERHCYDARPSVARWYNCREQGYVISMRDAKLAKQINIAFFEHRNSDELHAIRWHESTINPPTIDTAKFGNVYKTKYDTSHSVPHDNAAAMAEWIVDELTSFWLLQQSKAA